MRLARQGFSLLEVVVALGILAISLFVLVESQGTAALMTVEAEDMTVATYLAREKMSQVALIVESEGFQEQEIAEEGDFEQGVYGGWKQGALDGEFYEVSNDDAFEKYRWAYTVREVELSFDADMAGMADQLSGSGYFGDQAEESMDQQDQQLDLGDAGVSGDMITDALSPFMREIRVLVWWGENEDETDQVELVTHIVNPSGQVTPAGLPTGGAGQ
jgi:prepilin-type N-terminal cleavage/methylation domain-containing protein